MQLSPSENSRPAQSGPCSMNGRLKSSFEPHHIKFGGDFPCFVCERFRTFTVAPPTPTSEKQRVFRLGVGKPWTRPDAFIHFQRMLKMRFRLVEFAKRRGEHSEIAAR